MVTNYVSERFDGKSAQEAFQSTMSSADDILLNAAITSAAGTLVDSVTAPKCFVAGTMVTTAAGLVAIENIQPGDVVLATNEETGEVAYKEVVRTFVNTTDEITHVTIENAEGEQETIDSTPEHPFYVEGLGWVEASSLHAGMTIWFANGTKGTVEDISNEGLEEPVTVYNFEVEDFHTYYVGECGVLVHNTCAPDGVIRDGSHIEDGKLKADVKYQTGEHDYVYTTNSDGLITNAHADNLQLKTHDGRLLHNSNTFGKESGDHAGHLIGDRFGGSPDLDNLVSQSRNVNLSEFKIIENQWAKAIENGQKVSVDIGVNYGSSLRPISFDVTYTIDGEYYSTSIMN